MKKPSGIGGQAVIEGVMMKNGTEYAVSVRKPNGEIETEKGSFVSFSEKCRLFRLPILRGILAFIESLVLGTKTLTFSSGFFEEEETEPSGLERGLSRVFGEKAEKVIMGITVFVSIVLAVAIFMMLPFFISTLLAKAVENTTLLIAIEGVIRILIFVLYVLLISRMKEIRRVFMYHGAEHKCINCVENGHELTVENVKRQSRQHRRCGTSFMLYVMFISVIVFMFIRVESPWLRVLYRILLIPAISGISYEFIRLAGKTNFFLVRLLSVPGMWLQGLTTKEPEEDMIEVAIASVEAVFDWRAFLAAESEESQEERFARRKAEKEAARAAKRREKRELEESREEEAAASETGEEISKEQLPDETDTGRDNPEPEKPRLRVVPKSEPDVREPERKEESAPEPEGDLSEKEERVSLEEDAEEFDDEEIMSILEEYSSRAKKMREKQK